MSVACVSMWQEYVRLNIGKCFWLVCCRPLTGETIMLHTREKRDKVCWIPLHEITKANVLAMFFQSSHEFSTFRHCHAHSVVWCNHMQVIGLYAVIGGALLYTSPTYPKTKPAFKLILVRDNDKNKKKMNILGCNAWHTVSVRHCWQYQAWGIEGR